MSLVCSNLKKNYFFVAKGLRNPIVVIMKFSKKNCLCKQMNGTSHEVRLKNDDENEIRPDCFMREKLEISKFIIQVIFFSVLASWCIPSRLNTIVSISANSPSKLGLFRLLSFIWHFFWRLKETLKLLQFTLNFGVTDVLPTVACVWANHSIVIVCQALLWACYNETLF